MARTVEEVYQSIKTEISDSEILSEIDSISKASRIGLLVYIVAVTIVFFEKILDQHVVEVNNLIFEQKVPTARWYRNIALAFQYGFNLITDSTNYDDSAATEAEIEQSQIIKHAAVVQSTNKSSIIIKVATEENNELKPITDDQLIAFSAYMEEVSPLGTNFTIINEEADLLLPTIEIYRDPLIISETGQNILTAEQSIENAITNYLKELNFNGELIIQSLVDALQLIDGVEIVNVINLQTAAYNQTTETYDDLQPINVKHTANSGHFKVEDFSNITYVV